MQIAAKQYVKRCRAFTLVELILVVGTIGMVSGALVGVIGNSYKDFKAGSDRSALLQDGQAVIDQMVRTLRQAKAFVAVSASSDQAGSITYTTADDVSEQFKLNTQSSELEYEYGQPASLSALTGDVSGLVFTSYDTDGVALAGAVEPNSVKSVHIAMTLTGTQNTVTLTGRVYWPKDRQVISPDTGPRYTYPGSENRHYTRPVAWYKLDDMGDEFVLDSSGNGNHGLLEGPERVEGPTGQGRALDFDGDKDLVKVATPPKLLDPAAITIACWVKPARLYTHLDTSGDQGLISLDSGYTFKIYYAGLRFTTVGIKDHDSTNITLQVGTWQHVAATFQGEQDGDGVVFYLNGVEAERMSSSKINKATGPFRIASNQWNQTYEGLIDDVRLYDYKLSATQIKNIHAGKAVGSPLVWFQFEGMAEDSSGNGNHGRLKPLAGPPAVVPGLIGKAFSFDGVDDYVDCGKEPGSATALTVAFWMKADAVKYAMPIDKHTLSGGRGWTVKLRKDGGLWWRIGSNDNWDSDIHINSVYEVGVWVHVACTFANGTSRVYVNGELRGTKRNITHAVDNTTTALRMGVPSTVSSSERFDGLLDDVRIYDVALTKPEMTALCFEWKEGALD